MKQGKLLALVLVALILSGCAATRVAIEKRELAVNTRMSETIFLDPVGQSKKTFYLQFRNTSDKQSVSLKEELKNQISSKGYRLEQDPDKAHFILQVNVLQAGKTDPAAASQALASGFGGALVGAASAGVIANHISGSGLAAAGLIGAGVELLANSMVKDVTFSLITDIQISERSSGEVKANTKMELKEGTSGTTKVQYENTINRLKYRTRIVSTANKVNLKFEQALPELKKGLVNSIAGLLE